MNYLVEKYLKELLFDHDCVIIPQFGGFISTYMGSEISIAKNKITPARKQIKFNDKLSANDGLLIEYIAEKENSSILDAQKDIEKYIAFVKVQIEINSQYTIESLGRIYVNDDNNFAFEQYLRFNYLTESFGLPDLYFKPIDRTLESKTLFKPKKAKLMASNIKNELEDEDAENQYNASENEIDDIDLEELERQQAKKKTENLAIYYIMAIMALVLTAGTAYYLNMDKTTYAIGGFSPLSLFGRGEIAGDSNNDNKLLPAENDEEQKADGESSDFNTDESTTPDESTQQNSENQSSIEPVVSASTASSVIDDENLVSTKNGRFYIIAGGFKNKRKAATFLNTLISAGNPSKIIDSYDESGIYRVTIADFATYEEAQTQKKTYATEYGEELWVLNY
ncbi:MAG: SPOR domain-containing protein [Cytophagales bacterium]